jgi:hypothetical protein
VEEAGGGGARAGDQFHDTEHDKEPGGDTCGGDPGGETEAGLDVVVCAGGPMIVDVNAFPGFNGVPGAVTLIGGRIAHRAAP